MIENGVPFDRAVGRQLALNRSRTPAQRFDALCDLLDTAREMAPRDPAAVERRRRAMSIRTQHREQWRERCRRFVAAERAGVLRGD